MGMGNLSVVAAYVADFGWGEGTEIPRDTENLQAQLWSQVLRI